MHMQMFTSGIYSEAKYAVHLSSAVDYTVHVSAHTQTSQPENTENLETAVKSLEI